MSAVGKRNFYCANNRRGFLKFSSAACVAVLVGRNRQLFAGTSVSVPEPEPEPEKGAISEIEFISIDHTPNKKSYYKTLVSPNKITVKVRYKEIENKIVPDDTSCEISWLYSYKRNYDRANTMENIDHTSETLNDTWKRVEIGTDLAELQFEPATDEGITHIIYACHCTPTSPDISPSVLPLEYNIRGQRVWKPVNPVPPQWFVPIPELKKDGGALSMALSDFSTNLDAVWYEQLGYDQVLERAQEAIASVNHDLTKQLQLIRAREWENGDLKTGQITISPASFEKAYNVSVVVTTLSYGWKLFFEFTPEEIVLAFDEESEDFLESISLVGKDLRTTDRVWITCRKVKIDVTLTVQFARELNSAMTVSGKGTSVLDVKRGMPVIEITHKNE